MKIVTVDKDLRTVVLDLDTRFYPMDAVMQASQAYLETCWVYVDGDAEGLVRVTLTPRSKKIRINQLGYEFLNYVLSVMKA
ncbi:MAG: HxsD-like protein [Candidatus Undinarchaeales archaeon]|jgi:hypothetical protein|nr:HxsD-like protein [Candidatus Undinarchaeales archaeon]MDP7491654.1 HxsD-like protein [Candidatus Undinarchaeales archaeon]|tara:strand:+ start:240 stop:482 length:243 start_codon:yes stop_codon:yes gene_type:complete